ncbi:Gluconate transport-inducing protein [Meyerozyma guilliermondii]
MHIIPEYNTTSDEISYSGALVTAFDALLILEGCRRGIIPEIKRRLTSHQRDNIVPYMVYAWDETACGMKRWTDGKNWSASRVQGPFLTYRELDSERNTKPMGLIKQSFSVTTKQNHRLHVIAYALPMAEPHSSNKSLPNAPQSPSPPSSSSNPCGIAVPPYSQLSNIHGLLQYGPGRPMSNLNRPDHDENALKALDKSFTNT